MRKNERYRYWIIRNADILERKESSAVRKRKKKQIMVGEKITGIGFFLIALMGSALDGSEWKIPLMGVIAGVVIMIVGEVVVRMESVMNVQYLSKDALR